MDRKEYLNQISAKTTPTKKGLPSFLTSKFFWIIIACLFGIVLILGIGAALSGNKTTTEDRVTELILQLDGLNSTIGEYQDSIRSSTLRGYSASLSSILGSTSSNLTAFATEKYDYKPKNVDKKLQDSVNEHMTELNDELFSAKINGNLDEIFDLKMVYEISLVATQEEAILKSSQNESLQEMLTSSLSSLERLYDNFDQYTLGM